MTQSRQNSAEFDPKLYTVLYFVSRVVITAYKKKEDKPFLLPPYTPSNSHTAGNTSTTMDSNTSREFTLHLEYSQDTQTLFSTGSKESLSQLIRLDSRESTVAQLDDAVNAFKSRISEVDKRDGNWRWSFQPLENEVIKDRMVKWQPNGKTAGDKEYWIRGRVKAPIVVAAPKYEIVTRVVKDQTSLPIARKLAVKMADLMAKLLSESDESSESVKLNRRVECSSEGSQEPLVRIRLIDNRTKEELTETTFNLLAESRSPESEDEETVGDESAVGSPEKTIPEVQTPCFWGLGFIEGPTSIRPELVICSLVAGGIIYGLFRRLR
ncbi:hypothetical protein BJ508DRAFT_416911 [Ascobolus immersus RN42]|uniref:Uncharacterized protein n=1 Tax=Ascobolus immersus RN42 TaxID=1160509 RepID=A0A3N4HZ52_ASCIM|nr:hypothetical protein BJ508DRAFT_416911 [Ascobolus immersus RN42]